LVGKRKAWRGMTEGTTHEPLRARLRSASGRSSKIIKDRKGIEAVVEMPGRGRLVLYVDSGGGYSLRGRPEGKQADEADKGASRDLLVVGVMRADGIGSIRPEKPSAEHEL
jgi:hypothetical protein